DGRVDLVHIGVDNQRLTVRTLLSNGDGSWQPRERPPISGVDASDTRGWRTADINADGTGDLVHLDAAGGDLNALILLGRGDGAFTTKTSTAWPGFGSTDTRRWQVADVNADGATD